MLSRLEPGAEVLTIGGHLRHHRRARRRPGAHRRRRRLGARDRTRLDPDDRHARRRDRLTLDDGQTSSDRRPSPRSPTRTRATRRHVGRRPPYRCRPPRAGSRSRSSRTTPSCSPTSRWATRTSGRSATPSTGLRHANLTAHIASNILHRLGYDDHVAEVAGVAGFMHDIGNCVSRDSHWISAAFIARDALARLGMPYADIATVMNAVGNHEEDASDPATPAAAAVVLADKADVHHTRVRNPDPLDVRHPRPRELRVEAQFPARRLRVAYAHSRNRDRHHRDSAHGVLRDLPRADAAVPPRRGRPGRGVLAGDKRHEAPLTREESTRRARKAGEWTRSNATTCTSRSSRFS